MPTKRPSAGYNATIALTTAILQGYAEKAVFRGFSAHPKRGGQAVYKMAWHYDRPFELLLDVPGRTLTFPHILPAVPMRSPMYRELKAFVAARQSDEMPAHRRVDRAKARFKLANERGVVSIALAVKDGDFEYAARKLVQVVHEIFVAFLIDGPYFDYTVEHLGLDPDVF